jgi:uncharacterized protein YcgI (DUF1989 family)
MSSEKEVLTEMKVVPPRSGVAFVLKQGEHLRITDIEGEQVADLICYNLDDPREVLSSGRTIDYASTIFLTAGHPFYSNRSNVMFDMVQDTVGRHDFLLSPCSAEMFRKLYGHNDPHHGCFGNLTAALAEFGIAPDNIPVCFNVFMHVVVDGNSGQIQVLPPKSRAGDYIVLEARMDLIVGLTACSAGMSNNFAYKPIGYQVY